MIGTTNFCLLPHPFLAFVIGTTAIFFCSCCHETKFITEATNVCSLFNWKQLAEKIWLWLRKTDCMYAWHDQHAPHLLFFIVDTLFIYSSIKQNCSYAVSKCNSILSTCAVGSKKAASFRYFTEPECFIVQILQFRCQN